MKTYKKVIIFTEGQLKMVDELKEKTGFATLAEIIRNGLAAYHKTYYPAYSTSSKGSEVSEETAIRHAEIKARAKIAAEKATEDKRNEKKIHVCENILGGHIEETSNGDKMCSFMSYGITPAGDHENIYPISQIDPVLAETSLFLPSKTSVWKHRPEVRQAFRKLDYYKEENNEENI